MHGPWVRLLQHPSTVQTQQHERPHRQGWAKEARGQISPAGFHSTYTKAGEGWGGHMIHGEGFSEKQEHRPPEARAEEAVLGGEGRGRWHWAPFPGSCTDVHDHVLAVHSCLFSVHFTPQEIKGERRCLILTGQGVARDKTRDQCKGSCRSLQGLQFPAELTQSLKRGQTVPLESPSSKWLDRSLKRDRHLHTLLGGARLSPTPAGVPVPLPPIKAKLPPGGGWPKTGCGPPVSHL